MDISKKCKLYADRKPNNGVFYTNPAEIYSQKKPHWVILRSSIINPAPGPASVCKMIWYFPSGSWVNNQSQPFLSRLYFAWNVGESLLGLEIPRNNVQT